jgi:hypothetical protein
VKLIWILGIALFARQYGVTCQKCHTVIPHLNAFGAHFLAAGDRIPGVSSWPSVPISAKINLLASTEQQGDGPDGQGLPRWIVDEIEIFSAGTIGTRADYFIEQYAVDGGEKGLLRDAWISDRLNPWNARIPLYVQAGQFTLPVPVDPETFRETYQDYTLFVQTAGNNPFDFFTPAIGAKLTIGDTLRGLNAQLFAGPGYDRVSGLAKTGVDMMINLSDAIGPVTPTWYHFQGERPVGAPLDRFWRNGFGLVYAAGKLESQSVLQTGYDSNPSGLGIGTLSSGGFTQLRYAFDQRFFALARYEGTNEPNDFSRDTVVLLGYGPFRQARLTIEDVIAHQPSTTNTINVQYTEGF